MKIDLFNGHDGAYGEGATLLDGWTELKILNDFTPRVLAILRLPQYVGLDWAQALDTHGVHEEDDLHNHLRNDALAIIFHINSFGEASANGSEVLYLTSNDETKRIANNILTKVCSVLGTTNRGLKDYTDYYAAPFIRQKTNKALIIELFFGTNRNDLNSYLANRDKLAIVIADLIIGLCGGQTSPEVPEVPPIHSHGEDPRIVKQYTEHGTWISSGTYPVIAFPTLTSAINFDDTYSLNQIYAKGEVIAEYDTVYMDSGFVYIHWVSDNGQHRYAPTSKIGEPNLIGKFQ